jgi:hypothetical protein
MTRAPSSFKKRDVTKAVEAVTAGGVRIARVEIDKSGRIIVIAAGATEEPETERGDNPWDKV